jgi:hypothetical protein
MSARLRSFLRLHRRRSDRRLKPANSRQSIPCRKVPGFSPAQCSRPQPHNPSPNGHARTHPQDRTLTNKTYFPQLHRQMGVPMRGCTAPLSAPCPCNTIWFATLFRPLRLAIRMTSGRPLCAVSRLLAANPRSSAAVCSVCVNFNCRAHEAPESTDCTVVLRESYFPHLGNQARIGSQGGWYNSTFEAVSCRSATMTFTDRRPSVR